MAIDAVTPASREIAAISAVPQHSLTRRDRVVLVEEGQPPMEVAETELEALHWRKREELREKWKRRQDEREARGEADQGEAKKALQEADQEEDEEVREEPEPIQKSAEAAEEDETGTLFNDRS